MEEWRQVSGFDYEVSSIGNGLQKPMRGELHGNARLDEVSIQVIKDCYTIGQYKQNRIAAYFNIAQQTVSDIINSKRWAHV